MEKLRPDALSRPAAGCVIHSSEMFVGKGKDLSQVTMPVRLETDRQGTGKKAGRTQNLH
jgi:hypothetical protein